MLNVVLVAGNWGLKGPAFFFVCLLYLLLKNAHLISQAYHWNAPTIDDVTSTLSFSIPPENRLFQVFCNWFRSVVLNFSTHSYPL